MRITQGCFSFLPDLTDTQIAAQINYCLEQNWAVALEFTDDPHPRNTYWNMWGLPMFDLRDPATAIDLGAEFRDAGIGEVLESLERDLVGLAPVKRRVREIAALLLVDRVRQRLGLATEHPSLHMSFSGNPGTG